MDYIEAAWHPDRYPCEFHCGSLSDIGDWPNVTNIELGPLHLNLLGKPEVVETIWHVDVSDEMSSFALMLHSQEVCTAQWNT